MECYNWKENRIYFKDLNGITFNIRLKGEKTVVNGASATGKTYLCSSIDTLSKDKNTGGYNTDNIFILNSDNMNEIEKKSNKLIIIDRADYILSRELVRFINMNDGDNRYLIFARKGLGLEISPNYYASMKLDNITKEISISYKFNVKGWD